MHEPASILPVLTRIKTHMKLGKVDYFCHSKHLEARKDDSYGFIRGIVGGHGGDVYWVAHPNTNTVAAYGWDEFELAPARFPCKKCEGTGMDFDASVKNSFWEACKFCDGSSEDPDLSKISEVQDT